MGREEGEHDAKAVGHWRVVAVVASAAPALAEARVRCAGRIATIVGTPGDDTLEGTRRADVIHGLGGFDSISGLGGDDVICAGHGIAAVPAGRGDDRVVGGPAADAVSGGPGADVVDGRGSEDILLGGPGNDRLRGGPLADVLDGGEGSDLLDGGKGGDVASFASSEHGVTADLRSGRAFGSGADLLRRVEHLAGSRHPDRLLGNGGRNTLAGIGGGDVIGGRAGDDTVAGGWGDDRLDGGAGRDVLVSSSEHPVTVDLARGRATGEGTDAIGVFEVVLGSPNDDKLRGSRGADTFRPWDGDDRVHGRGGVDLVSYAGSESRIRADLATGTIRGESTDRVRGVEGVRGTPEDDFFAGNALDNVFFGGDLTDRFVESAGNDVFHTGRCCVDFLDLRRSPVGANVDLRAGYVSVPGRGRDRLIGTYAVRGSAHADVLRAAAEGSFMDGRRGADEVRGRGGFDRLFGGEGDDFVAGAAAEDVLEGGAGADLVTGGSGIDEILDFDGDDVLQGGGDSDVIVFGPGDDRIDGGPGVDVVQGVDSPLPPGEILGPLEVDLEAGTATAPELGADSVTGIEGASGSGRTDRFAGDAAGNLFHGGNGAGDVILGGGGDDLILTSGSNADLAGGEGDDHIAAGPGEDRADAGPGVDECWHVEIPASCEAGASPPQAPFAGYRYPRGIAVRAGRGVVEGGVIALLGGDCSDGARVLIERWAGGLWATVERVRAEGLSGPIAVFSTEVNEPGRYRGRVESMPPPQTPEAECLAAVSRPVVLRR